MLKKIIFIQLIIVINLLCITKSAYSKTVEYTLNIEAQKVNITGKEAQALAINNIIPGPTIKAIMGDTLRIKVINHLNEETSIHWHGVLLPNLMDGVPYITTPPIKLGKSFIYEFSVKHSGTYWYHAHSGLQEQQGLFGPIIFYPKNEVKDYDEEHIVMLSDWTNENPNQVLSNIKKDPDYYALKKDSVQSWYKVLSKGMEAINLRIKNALSRMGPMDISDVGYDTFLINGKNSINLSHAKPGSRVKLRIVNAAASSYFILEYSGGLMKVIESDGMRVEPFTTGRIRIAMAETYDVIITVPDNKTYEFRATSEDGTGYATATIGSGALVPASTIPKPDLMLMKHEGPGSMGSMHAMSQMSGEMSNMSDHKSPKAKVDKTHMQHQSKELYASTFKSHIDYLNNYKNIKSTSVTTLPKSNPTRVVTLNLTGSMERYVWTINDKPMYASDKIVIKKGENVKFILVNKTMMHHPIHLHGHFFRVLSGQGDYSPLKHTVNVAPFETIEIEFYANEEKDWIFHCHNLYHMALGMGGVISYEGSEPSPELAKYSNGHSQDHGNKWFYATRVNGFSNFAAANTMFMNNDHSLVFDIRYNYKRDYEVEAIYQRYISQFLALYLGGDFKREHNKISNTAVIGFKYTLPLLIKADLQLNNKGKLRFGIANEHQLTDRISFDWVWNTDKEYTFGLNYALTKQIYISGNYDSREQFGIGISLRF